jgi:hypothetical protein
MKSVETVLLPGTKIKLLNRMPQPSIWRISTEEYLYVGDHYADERFFEHLQEAPLKRVIELPPILTILQKMEALADRITRYMWGGNWPLGIDRIAQLYPSRTPLRELAPLIQDTWIVKGVDCSGLLYYATNGHTPRNTSTLVGYGKGLSIEGKNIEEILSQLQNLDMIVWNGHALYVLNRETSIESKVGEGVVKRSLFDRLSEIMATRRPVDDWRESEGERFVIRRWHPQA